VFEHLVNFSADGAVGTGRGQLDGVILRGVARTVASTWLVVVLLKLMLPR
jgi:hypothetical protein